MTITGTGAASYRRIGNNLRRIAVWCGVQQINGTSRMILSDRIYDTSIGECLGIDKDPNEDIL